MNTIRRHESRDYDVSGLRSRRTQGDKDGIAVDVRHGNT